MVTRISKTITVSLPPELYKEVERLTKEGHKTKSELFREMIRTYKEQQEEKEFRRLQRYGISEARKSGIKTEEEVDHLIFKDR